MDAAVVSDVFQNTVDQLGGLLTSTNPIIDGIIAPAITASS